MFGTNTTGSSLTFGKILGGLSKTLSIANQVIPLYQQTKPMINNAKSILSVLKEFKSDNKITPTNNKTKIPEVKNKYKIETSQNNPTFFQ